MGRVAATVASTLCLLIGMAPAAMAKDGRDDDDGKKGRPDRVERIEEQILGKVLRADYDGLSNDLLTAGLGATGLANPLAPAPANPLAPTPEELRRLAIYNNYRALVDVSANGGYGRLYGPLVGAAGYAKDHDGRVAGTEYLALLDGNLKGQPVDAVAIGLRQARVPFCFVSGYGREHLPRGFEDAPLIQKPFASAALRLVLAELLDPPAARAAE